MFSASSTNSQPVSAAQTDDHHIRHNVIAGIDYAETREANGSEFSLTVTPLANEAVIEMFRRLSISLKELDATVTKLIVFGATNACAAGTESMRRVFGKSDWPVTWVEGASCYDQPIAGIQAFALAEGDVHRVKLNGRVVGSVFENGAARHCLLAGLGPDNLLRSRPDQARQTLDQLEAVLAQAGFSLSDVIRTWFFNDDLLSWYNEFNQVRTSVYSRVHFSAGALPASTGVAGRNLAGAALVLGAWAVKPLNASVQIKEVASSLQCPAPAYGSSFSRALEISSAHGKRLLISGTASIAPEGQTLWVGGAREQVALTMGVVEAILVSRGLAFSDTTRATAYFKHAADVIAFHDYCRNRHGCSFPVVPVHCDICRDDLLFEIELDAVSSGN